MLVCVGLWLNVSEFLQLIEIAAFVMEHGSCRPDGIMARPGATSLENALVAVLFGKPNA